MKFKTKINRLFALIALAAVAVGGFAAVRFFSARENRPSSVGVYYCPMHPAYTSDRPGDCLICNMRLVKRRDDADAASPAVSTAGKTGSLKDVCFHHDCPMVHEGKPCPMLIVARAGEEVKCPVCGTHVSDRSPAKGRAQILYWTDPMIPGFKSDKPGKSPMGMDLVPVYETAGEGVGTSAAAPQGYAQVVLSPQKQQLIGVKTAIAETRPIKKVIRAVGRIAYDPDLYQTEQEYIQSLRSLRTAEAGGVADLIGEAARLVESSRLKLRLKGLNDELIDEMSSWEKPDRSLLLADPEGRVWLYASIYESELPYVRTGHTVAVELPVTGRKLEGAIRAIDPVLDPATRSANIRAVLVDPEKNLKPGMYVNAEIRIDLGRALAVPETAVFFTGRQQIVFVDKGNGVFEPRDVTLGARADAFYEVMSGVEEGARVVTSGNFLIDSESRLKAALGGMGGADSSGGAHGGEDKEEGQKQAAGHAH